MKVRPYSNALETLCGILIMFSCKDLSLPDRMHGRR